MVAEAGEIKEAGLISDAKLTSLAFNYDYHRILRELQGIGRGGELQRLPMQEKRNVENFPTNEAYFF